MKEYLNRLDEDYHQMITTKFSLEEQINTYRELLQGFIFFFFFCGILFIFFEGRRGLQFHIDRIIRRIDHRCSSFSLHINYLNKISKTNLPFVDIKG